MSTESYMEKRSSFELVIDLGGGHKNAAGFEDESHPKPDALIENPVENPLNKAHKWQWEAGP